MLLFDGEGVSRKSQHDGHVDRKCRWSEVTEISAWKDDLWTYDIIHLTLRVSSSEAPFEFEEDDPGWPRLLEELAARFELPSGWYPTIMFPAFARNFTILWRC